MTLEKKFFRSGLISLAILTGLMIMGISLSHAQYWQALPPYNILWPLWSPALSPVDPVTGISVPLINELSNDTILPVQSVMAWDPAQQFPWLLYNIPSVLGGGLSYFSPYYGHNPWPPSYLTDPVSGSPVPITLPLGFESLPPPGISEFGRFYNPANIIYAILYPPSQFNYSFTSLLTPADVWGLPTL
ncbi:hypothetical protein JXL19_05165 [bacterium]|nr:hypothetical protein [bacterium]